MTTTDVTTLPTGTKDEGRAVGVIDMGGGMALAPRSMGEVIDFARVMASGGLVLPKHLRGNVGACMGVTMQALRWGMDPFAVAAKSYSINDAISYEAQLVHAVVNTRAPLEGRLKIGYRGEGQMRQCIVTGKLRGDPEPKVYTSPPIGGIKVQNSPLWKSDPDQQLAYYSTRAWARRYVPEVLLGVYTPDEIEEHRGPERARDVTPPRRPASRLEAFEQAAEVRHEPESDVTAEEEAPATASEPDDEGARSPAPAPDLAGGAEADAAAPAEAEGFALIDVTGEVLDTIEIPEVYARQLANMIEGSSQWEDAKALAKINRDEVLRLPPDLQGIVRAAAQRRREMGDAA